MSKTKPSRIFASGDATTLYLTLPAAIVSDSQFPFGPDDTVQITIDNGGLRIMPINDSTESRK
jgi:hypothetical protein